MFQKFSIKFVMTGFVIFACSSLTFAQGVNSLNGEWHVQRGILNGQEVPDDVLESMSLNVSQGKFTASSGGLSSKGMFASAGAADELAVTIDEGADAGRKLSAKWRMESGRLTIAYGQTDAAPRDFNSGEGSDVLVLYYASGPRPASTRRSTASNNRRPSVAGGNDRKTSSGGGAGKKGGGGAMTLN